MNCRKCGNPMRKAGIAASDDFECSNGGCPSAHSQVVCPKCKVKGDTEVRIDANKGFGSTVKTCLSCGHQWPS